MAELTGRVALVTGAASGIGRAASELFARRGAQVFMVDRDQPSLEATAAARASDLGYAVADVSSESDTRDYVRAAVERFGGLDIAVLNAGIFGGFNAITDVPVESFDQVLAVNVRGVFLGLKHVMPVMKERGGGSIVVTASSTAFRAGAPGRSPYVTSKHAVVGLVRCAAVEGAAFGIRVNSVCPGGVKTPMTESLEGMFGAERAAEMLKSFEATVPLGRIAQPEEVAEVMLFLASDRSRYCTASNYLVDGGLLG